MKPLKRGNTYYLKARVPTCYHSVESRRMILHSLKTDSHSLACIKLPQVWNELTAAWELRLQGRDEDAHKRYEAARRIADQRGFSYLPQADVIHLSARDLVDRVRAIPTDPQGNRDPVEARAMLGAVAKPRISLDDALDFYMKSKKTDHKDKSEAQVEHVISRKKAAIDRFKEAVGDIPIEEITRADLFTYRNWWADQIAENGWNPSTATKGISELSSMLKEVFKVKLINLDLNFSGLAFKAKDNQRPPFSDKWIKEKIMAPGALDGLDKDARCILLGMINTGYRPVEGANLTADRIKLEGDIPHIIIRGEGRELKNAMSERIIPLTGVSLEAFKECPNGFPKYSDDKGSLSVIVNQYLSSAGLRETEKHSFYCLRHSFSDRVLNADVDERIRRDLMGHTLNGVRYGSGGRLDKVYDLLKPIAL